MGGVSQDGVPTRTSEKVDREREWVLVVCEGYQQSWGPTGVGVVGRLSEVGPVLSTPEDTCIVDIEGSRIRFIDRGAVPGFTGVARHLFCRFR